MTIKAPVNPVYGAASGIAATSTAQTVVLKARTKQVMITNTGPDAAYVRITPNVLAATSADAILPPNSMPIVFTKFEDILSISVVSGGTTSNLHIMPCEGFSGT